MYVLRWGFLLACLASILIVAWGGRWEGRLHQADRGTWILDLGRAPIWAPPADPSYASFRDNFKESQDFPVEGTTQMTIGRVMRIDWMVTDFLLYLWPVTLIGGLGYLAVRKGRRSLILHLGLSIGIGLTIGAATCLGLWLLFGGWGAPAPNFFGGMGSVMGIVFGLASFRSDGSGRIDARWRQIRSILNESDRDETTSLDK